MQKFKNNRMEEVIQKMESQKQTTIKQSKNKVVLMFYIINLIKIISSNYG